MSGEKNSAAPCGGSFRDPDGFVFRDGDGRIRRQINPGGFADFELLDSSGLYSELSGAGKLVPHKIISRDADKIIIEPEQIPFISYPYEWSFSMYRDAALLTLELQMAANARGMSLKDASAYNVQFRDGRPVFIDTLSFEKLSGDAPWVAYGQFCSHFLAPLLLMSYRDFNLGKLMRDFIGGIPLDLAAGLLPVSTRFNLPIAMHLHWHAGMMARHSSDGAQSSARRAAAPRISPLQRRAILDSLHKLIARLRWRPNGTEWGDYYSFTNYTPESFDAKKKIIEGFLDLVKPSTLWDLGANNGIFTRLAASRNCHCCAFDIDPVAVEKNYLRLKQSGEKNLLPLVMDLTNPSPALGWDNRERDSLAMRARPGECDMTMMLALIHHLAISNNLPFARIAEFAARLSPYLVIEFVPKSDSKVQILLATREDIFPEYDEAHFRSEFGRYYTVAAAEPIPGSERTLYLLKRR